MRYSKTFLSVIACALPFMTFIVAGLSIYLVNRNEIAFDLLDVVLPLTGLFLIISVLFFLFLCIFRRFPAVSGILTGLVVGLSLAVWVQSQLLLWNFGQFNGQGIVWKVWKINMFIDGAVWVVIIVVSMIVFMKRKRNFERALVMVVYLLGSFSVLSGFLNAPKKIASQIGESEYQGIFIFHPQKNVLVILLDDFQSDYFNYLATEYPDEIKELDGFTFYRNTISKFPTTKTSLPSIITGALYRNEQGYNDYIRESYKNFNIIQAYKNKSYSTFFVGQLQGLFPDVMSMENVAYKMQNDIFYQFFEYLDYAVFRAFPTFLKPIIYNQGNWFLTFHMWKKYPPSFHGGDVRFLELFEKHATVNGNTKGSFKFFHFYIPHEPLCVNENLQFDPGLKGDKGYIKQTRGAIRLVSRILKKLKELGIYDQSEIVIMSDHGTGNLGAIKSKDAYNPISMVPSFVQSASLALLLHKPANSNGKLVISDVPLELTDLACLLGLQDNDSICRGFNMAKSGGLRERIFYFYEWKPEYWGSDHMPPMKEYIVTGPSYNPESYSVGKYIYTSDGIKTIPSLSNSPYTLGKEIIFSAKGNGEAEPYIRAGWSFPEAYQLWSVGPAAGLSFHLKKVPDKDLVLRIHCFGYLGHNKINCQVVTVIVNQVSIGRWFVNGGKWYEAVIPHNLIPDRTVNIVFKISNPMAPIEVEDSKDIRRLGIGVASMVMYER